MMCIEPESFRRCLRDTTPEIADAARYLDAVVSAHHLGRSDLADTLIRLADIPMIRAWTESLWGKNSRYVKVRQPSAVVTRVVRAAARMPTAAEKALLHRAPRATLGGCSTHSMRSGCWILDAVRQSNLRGTVSNAFRHV